MDTLRLAIQYIHDLSGIVTSLNAASCADEDGESLDYYPGEKGGIECRRHKVFVRFPSLGKYLSNIIYLLAILTKFHLSKKFGRF